MAKLPFGKNTMHIKKSTEGTSNEISFSVLDAKKNSAEEPANNSPRTLSELGKVSLFTMPGKQEGEAAPTASGFGMGRARKMNSPQISVGGTTLGGSPEVMLRKQRRRAWKLLNIAAILVVLGVLVMFGGRALSNFMERQQTNQNALDEAIALLEQTDQAFVALDEAIAAPAESNQENYDQILVDLSAAASRLDRATNSAEMVIAAQENSQLVEVATSVKESAMARKDLIEKGRTVLVTGSAAKAATELVEQSWAKALEADDLARQAADVLEEDQAKNLAQSTELSTKAMEGFQEALSILRQAKEAFPRADFTNLEAYLTKRAAAQQNALASNAAIQEQNRAIAEANSAAYNESEEEAAKIAATLPANPAQPIVDRYEEIGGASDQAYQDARARAARADAEVRNYVGDK